MILNSVLNFESEKNDFDTCFGIITEIERNSEAYTGEYNVIPKAKEEVILETKNKKMMNDVTVKKIPYFQTSNESGQTVYIGGEVEWQ